MAYNTAAKAYGNNRIETATPAELTLMLYEGAVIPEERMPDNRIISKEES